MLVNEKIQKDYNLLKLSKQQMSEEEALKIIGGDLNLWGVGGNDTLKGGGGNDIIDGGKGFNVQKGGAGSDLFVLDLKQVPGA